MRERAPAGVHSPRSARRRVAGAWRWVGLLLVCGCAATNYTEPTSPLYAGRYGSPAADRTGPAAGAAPDTGGTDAPIPAAPAPIRVVSFNIAYAVEIDSALAVLRSEAVLRQPDVLCLQEMDFPGTERLAAALGLNYFYFPSGVHPKYDRDFGCAVLSPWPLTEPRKILLPHGARITGLRRAVTVATLQRGALRLRVYAVHLSSPAGLSARARHEQVDILIADAKASPDPVVIAGDFNSEDVGEAFTRAGFAWPTRTIGPTTRAYGVGFRYDHVFAHRLRPWGAASVGVVTHNRDASDHYPIWALLAPE